MQVRILFSFQKIRMTSGSPGLNVFPASHESGPPSLVQYIMVNFVTLITIFKGSAENIFLMLVETYHITPKCSSWYVEVL